LILAVSGRHWEEIKDSNPRILVVGFGHFGTDGLNPADGSFVRARRRVIKVANPAASFSGTDDHMLTGWERRAENSFAPWRLGEGKAWMKIVLTTSSFGAKLRYRR
jgi:hypothetical protein